MPDIHQDEIDIRFKYHTPKSGQAEKYTAIRAMAKEFACLISAACPESREKSLAVTTLEESVMWANSAIARRE